ncbi:MAG: aminotransferase class III-fold pyridoxal phosphate-dependent enzyme, partial [Prochlorotrichaceae cyanobacterium]
MTIWHPFTQAKTTPPPLKVKSAAGVWLTLENGQRILDAISSWWVNVHGHAHPAIAKAIYTQAQILEQVIFAGFTHEPAEQLALKLQEKLPPRLEHVFFSDNG